MKTKIAKLFFQVLIILLLVLIFDTCMKAQRNQMDYDKFNHVYVGALIGLTANGLVSDFVPAITNKEYDPDGMIEIPSKYKLIGMISGVCIGTLAGHLKEKYDVRQGGIYNRQDLKATMLGALIGSVSFRIILGNSISRHQVPKQYLEVLNDRY